MQLFIAALIGALVQAAGTLVGKVLLSLGIGFVTFTGVGVGIEFLRDSYLAAITGLPPVSVQIAGVLKLGVVVNILASALVARVTLAGLTSDTVTRMVQK